LLPECKSLTYVRCLAHFEGLNLWYDWAL